MTDTTRSAGDGTDEGNAFAATRQAYVYARFPDGRCASWPTTSRPRPGTVTVDLDPHTVHRLLLAVGLRPPGLRQLLNRLTSAGMLTQIHGRDGEHLGVHTLRMPHPMISTRATDPGA